MEKRSALGRVELRHLRYFATVARELHFGRAARLLNMSQPPLSVQIRRLEEHLGVQLFVRASRGVELTAAGALLRDEVQGVFDRVNELLLRVRARAAGQTGSLRVGFVTPAAYGPMPEALALFRDACPDVELVLREMTTDAQLEELGQGSLDIGFVLPPVQRPDLAYEPLLSEPLILAMPGEGRARDDLEQAVPVSLRTMRDRPLVIFPRRHAPLLYDSIIALCQRAGYTPSIAQQAIEMQTIVSLVAAGIGIAIVPSSVRRMARHGVRYRRIRERSARIEMGLGWLASRDSSLLRRFRAAVHAAVARDPAPGS
ncbi:MAG: LysR family transcriptional regulator [Burkholderiaceae bacterium]|nr:LysR family transcriptional regulator [Burkholderiaceae bacterium]